MSPPTVTRPRRRFWIPRVSIRGMMVLVVLVGVGLGWPVAAMRRQAETVALIRQARSQAAYDWETSRGQFWRMGSVPPCSHWFCRRFTPDLWHPVTAVDLWGRVDDPLAERIGGLRRLEWLNVTDSPRFSDVGLAACAGLTQLQTLYMSQTAVTGVGLGSLRGMTRLQTLEAWGIPLDDAHCRHLSGLTELRFLGVTGRRLTDVGLAHLAPLTRLVRLNIDGTGSLAITAAGLAHLAGMKSLSCLIVPNTRITELAPIRSLSRLQLLDLSGAPLTDAGIAALTDLPQLDTLDLSRTKITDTGLDVLARCPKLVRVTLAETAVTLVGLERLHRQRPNMRINLKK